MQEATVRVIVHDSVTVKPGDTLVVRVAPDTSKAQADQLRNALTHDLPGVRVVLAPADQLLVLPGPQLDDPARPLVEPADSRPLRDRLR